MVASNATTEQLLTSLSEQEIDGNAIRKQENAHAVPFLGTGSKWPLYSCNYLHRITFFD